MKIKGTSVKAPTQRTQTPPYRNQQLFSEHYLDYALPNRFEWPSLAREAEEVMSNLQQLFAEHTGNTEAQIEDDWILPVLRRLGHTIQVQASLTTPEGCKIPDYIFYCDHMAKTANKNKVLDDTLLEGRAIAVGEAKAWDHPLDISPKRKEDVFYSNKNPSYQIAFYILHTGLDWGILTNGRLWRLYHKKTAQRP